MERRKILKLIAATGLSLGVAYATKETVEMVDSAFRPTYVVRGYAPPLDEKPLWQPRTRWEIVYSDGRQKP